ncbi:hypothetical protein GMSM_35610 [Geomonas sp. Red276]
MAKSKKHPRYNVVSVRVSDEERQMLEKLSADENKKVSELIREALQTMTPPK